MSASPPPASPPLSPASESESPAPTTPPPMPSAQELYESALRELEDATKDLESCLPSYSPPAVVVLREADVRGVVEEGHNQLANAAAPAQQGNKASLPKPTLESLLVSRGRHKPSSANRAVGYVRRLTPLARVAGLGDGSEALSSPSLVAALNALALIFAVTTRQDDALDQLEKIAYQASRSPASPTLTPSSSPQTSRIRNASLSTPSSPISPSHQHNTFFGAAPESDAVLTLRTPAVQLLSAVIGFLKGALRRAGPPGTLRGRAPLGGAQAYAAAKGKLNVGVAGWDRGIRGWEGDE